MPSKYGINVELINSAPNSYDIENSRPIAIVGDDTQLSGLSVYNSVDLALQAVGSGSVANTLKDLESCNLRSQIIISAFSKEISPDDTPPLNPALPLEEIIKIYKKWIVLVVAGQSQTVGYDESIIDDILYTSKDAARIMQISGRDWTSKDYVPLGRTALSLQDMDSFGVNKNGTKGLHLPLANLIIDCIPDDYGLLILPIAYGDTGFTRTSLNATKLNALGNANGRNGKWGVSNSYLYDLLKEKIKFAMENPDNKFLGVVWIQGEADNANVESHKIAFEAMTQDFFTHMQDNYPNRSVSGVYDKNLWFIPSTTFYWDSTGAKQIWENYKEWNPNTFVEIKTTSNDTNATNGVVPANGKNGSTSSAADSHYGNNAYARLVAPAILQSMIKQGLFGEFETQISYESAKDSIIARKQSLGTDNDVTINENGDLVSLLDMSNTSNATKWTQNSAQHPVLIFDKSIDTIEFTATRGLYWLITHINDDGSNVKFFCLHQSQKNSGNIALDNGVISNIVKTYNPIPFNVGDKIKIEAKDNTFTFTINDGTPIVRNIAYDDTFKTTIGFMFNIGEGETQGVQDLKLLASDIKIPKEIVSLKAKKSLANEISLDDEDLSSQDTTQLIINNKAITAITLLKKCEQEFKLKPKFILATEYNDSGIYEKLKQIATSLRAIYAIELDSKDEVAIKKELESIQTHRAIISFQKVERIDKVIRPASAFLIALYAKIMSSSDYGFAQTYSNRVIDGVISIKDTIEYIQGEDCECDRLRDLGITCIFVDNGIRAWGRNTRDSALGIESLHSIVIFDTIIDTLFESQKEAIDKQVADMVKALKDDLSAFYRKLIANGVVVGFEISLPDDLNTNEAIANGEIYIKQEVQEMPLISKVVNKIYRVTKYSQELIKEL